MSRPRRLLIIAYHFPPSGAVASFRLLGFARHLPRYGWQVGVVAPPCVPGEPVDKGLLDRVPEETALFRAAYPTSVLARLARRGLYHGVWLPRALPEVIQAVRCFRPDAVLTSGPPHCVHVLGLFLKRFYGIPWAACLRDEWFTNYPPSMSQFPWARWEGFWKNRVYQAADCIIANTPLEREGLQKAHPRISHKVTHVTNGFDPEDFPLPKPIKQLNERLTILHAGELYAGRDPRPFFDALQALEKSRLAGQQPIRLRLLGQSTDPNWNLRSFISERGLNHVVELPGQVSYAEALTAMTEADVLLLLDTPGRKRGVPAKLFEYLGAARPILALGEADGDLAWVLRQSGVAHRIAPLGDANTIQQALTELRDGLCDGSFEIATPAQTSPAPFTGRAGVGSNGGFELATADPKAPFTRAKLAGDLAHHLNHMLNPEPADAGAAPTAPSCTTNHALQRHHSATASRPHYTRA